MRECAGCRSWIPDDVGACPACGRAASPAPPAAPAAPPPAAAPPPPPPPDPGAEARAAAIRARAAARVRMLGVLYLLHGGMLLALVAMSAWQYASGAGGGEVPEEILRFLPAEYRDALEEARPLTVNPGIQLAAHFLPFVLAVLLLWSGAALRHLQRREAAIGAAVGLLLLSPCQSCCCLAAIPLGLYALYVLTAGETKVVTT